MFKRLFSWWLLVIESNTFVIELRLGIDNVAKWFVAWWFVWPALLPEATVRIHSSASRKVELEQVLNPARRPGPGEELAANETSTRYYPCLNLKKPERILLDWWECLYCEQSVAWSQTQGSTGSNKFLLQDQSLSSITIPDTTRIFQAHSSSRAKYSW